MKTVEKSDGDVVRIEYDPKAIKDAGSNGIKNVAGAVSAVAHAPFSIAGPFLAPTGYERKDHHTTVSGERWIGIGTGLAVGTVTQLMRGSDLVGALLWGGTVGAVAGAAGVSLAHHLNGWKPILLDKIAEAKGAGADSTSGSDWRKAGAAYRKGYGAGFEESWQRGERGVEQVGELASDAVKAGSEFTDGFMNPGT